MESVNLKELGRQLEEKDCPDLYRNILMIEDTLDVLAGKWKIPILFAVLKGRHKFSEIISFCPRLTDKVLNNKLKELIEYKMIEKRGQEYYLTEHGISLYKVIQELCTWGERHRRVMLEWTPTGFKG